MPASKLREVTGISNSSSQRKTAGGRTVTGPRSSRNQRKVIDYSEDFGDEEDEEEELDDAEGEEDEEMDDFDKIGAEAEGGTDDDDMEMQEAPPPPTTRVRIKAPNQPPTSTRVNAPRGNLKATSGLSSSPAPKGTAANPSTVKPVEEQEMELDPDDDELSEEEDLDDEDEDENEEDEEDDEEEDAEGDEDEGEDDDELNDSALPTVAVNDVDAEEDDEDLDDGLNPDGSRASTPDYARLTKRQRNRGDEVEGGFMALPMEPQIKKHFTAEEHRMRRAEMARRRKNLSEKRNEEEKMTTINKLLKKQTTKKRGKSLAPDALSAAVAADSENPNNDTADNEELECEEEEIQKPNPLYARWVSGKNGIKLGVPEEWIGKKVGRYFEGAKNEGPARGARLVQEVK
ncbi:hypothetical protein UCRPC4_g03356 [Phaeomoniella chlamydospora]|uniref:INO80 complex subunit B-like conserved region domain-containing protein n=1 Tax=Phaeomoniella chlamydospora TaxID=158046 RepID=A0A0G2EIF2_PHACM|nr:hypothetical protein UCRPC4_g03356 [Phaeomoniella chlamydospora]